MLGAYLHLLRTNRNYRLLWLAQVVSELGDWFYSLSVYHLLLELTGNRAQSVGLAVVLQVLPQTLAAPTAGVVNDRVSRKAIMIGADIARCLIVLGMLLVRTPGMVWLVYPLLLVETIGAAFFEPAHSAVIPNIVPEEQVLAANALASVTWSFCLAAGASLGGVVAVLLGRDAVFVKFGVGLLGANNVLLPILGQRVFPVKVGGLDSARGAMLGMSLLMGARGAGALVGPLISGWWAGEHHSRLRSGILAGFLAAAAGYVCLGKSASLGLAILAVMVGHGGSSTNWVFSTTLLQFYTGDRFRGRVFAADLGLCMLGISASSYLAGVALDMGVTARAFAVGMGGVMLVPAAAWAAAIRKTAS